MARVITLPAIVTTLLIGIAPAVSAQEIEPRSYANTPVGINFLIAGYAFSDGEMAVDPSVPLTNAEIRTSSGFVAYARALDLGGRSAKFDVIAPYATADGSADFEGERREREVSGFMDPAFRLSVNLFGAPALALPEFRSYQQDLIIGASLQVRAPWGQYNDDKLLNNGTNRWSVKPEVGISKAHGPWTFEFSGAVNFIGDNDDFLDGVKLEQDPIYSAQAHVIYGFASGIWMAVDGTWYTGGRTTLDGVPGGDLRKNTRAGVTIALPLNRRHSIKLYGSTGMATRAGSDADVGGIAWQYRWGNGL